jgi:hypothetical protein
MSPASYRFSCPPLKPEPSGWALTSRLHPRAAGAALTLEGWRESNPHTSAPLQRLAGAWYSFAPRRARKADPVSPRPGSPGGIHRMARGGQNAILPKMMSPTYRTGATPAKVLRRTPLASCSLGFGRPVQARAISARTRFSSSFTVTRATQSGHRQKLRICKSVFHVLVNRPRPRELGHDQRAARVLADLLRRRGALVLCDHRRADRGIGDGGIRAIRHFDALDRFH